MFFFYIYSKSGIINVSDLSVGDYEVNLTATKGTKTYTAETSKLIVKAISKPLEISRIILSEDESLSDFLLHPNHHSLTGQPCGRLPYLPDRFQFLHGHPFRSDCRHQR